MRDPGRGRACVLRLFVLQFGVCLLVSLFTRINLSNLAGFVYGRQGLINIGLGTNSSIKRDYQQAHNIPLDIAREPGAPWILCGHLKRRKRRREEEKEGLPVRSTSQTEASTVQTFASEHPPHQRRVRRKQAGRSGAADDRRAGPQQLRDHHHRDVAAPTNPRHCGTVPRSHTTPSRQELGLR